MKLIMGLGNPGEAYAATRHNIGRRLIEHIAASARAGFKVQRSQKASVASVSWNEETVLLAYPSVYMNLSGETVAALANYFKIAAGKDLLIVVDDAALPFGKFRLRASGSAGGHNGLASIEDHLRACDYPRLRIGIGAPERNTAADLPEAAEPLREHVLSPFTASEERKMEKLLEAGAQACRDWVANPIAKAMNRINALEI